MTEIYELYIIIVINLTHGCDQGAVVRVVGFAAAEDGRCGGGRQIFPAVWVGVPVQESQDRQHCPWLSAGEVVLGDYRWVLEVGVGGGEG